MEKLTLYFLTLINLVLGVLIKIFFNLERSNYQVNCMKEIHDMLCFKLSNYSVLNKYDYLFAIITTVTLFVSFFKLKQTICLITNLIFLVYAYLIFIELQKSNICFIETRNILETLRCNFQFKYEYYIQFMKTIFLSMFSLIIYLPEFIAKELNLKKKQPGKQDDEKCPEIEIDLQNL